MLYNSAVMIGPKGYVGTFRKVHLWNEENLFFQPGNVGFPVFKTPIGRDWMSHLLRQLVSGEPPSRRPAGR